jgi:hypothetical protein
MRNRSDTASILGFSRRFSNFLSQIGFNESISVIISKEPFLFGKSNSIFPFSSLVYRSTDRFLLFLKSLRKNNIKPPIIREIVEEINVAIVTNQIQVSPEFFDLSGNNFVIVFEEISSIPSLPFLIYICDQDRNLSFRIDSFKDSKFIGSRFIRIPNNRSHIALERNIFATIVENITDFSFHVQAIDYSPVNSCDVTLSRFGNMNLLLIQKATVQIITQTFRNFLEVFVKKKSKWHICIFHRHTQKITEISNPKNRWLADPFLFQNNNELYVFAEDFDIRSGIGRISVATISNSSVSSFEICHIEDFHISFPRLFTFNSKIYASVESSEVGGLRIYEVLDFPYKWNLISNFFSDRVFVDPIVFKFNNAWYLLVTEKTKFGNDFFTNLNLFSSSNPVLGPWISAEVNPILTDCEIGRNGGLFDSEGKTYRVAQKYHKGIYGSEITIFQVLDADVYSYKEQLSELLNCDVAHLKPRVARQFHTYNQLDDLAVFDWK